MHQKRSLPKTRVLVTGAGGPAAVGFMRGVDREPVVVFAADIDPLAQGLYLVPPAQRLLVPRGDDPAFVDAVLASCDANGITILVPTVESELMPLALRADEFARAGVRLMLASPETLALTLDKWEMFGQLGKTTPLPQTHLLDDHLGADDLLFPMVAKPRTGGGSNGIVMADGEADLQPLPRDGSHIVQEYLPGPEFSVDVLRLDGRQIAAVPRERLKTDSGIAVTSRTVHDAQLEDLASVTAERIDLEGVANVQFRMDRSGAPRLLEVNPRFPGTMALTIAAGVNMPALWLRTVLGRGGVSEITGFREIAMVRTLLDQVVPVAEIEAMSRATPEFISEVAA